MRVQEVYPGSMLHPDSEFVELQMFAPGQTMVTTHAVRLFSATGTETASATFTSNVANAQSQQSILVGTTAAAAEFGMPTDLTIAAGLDPAGGAACWDTIDCVSWGSFSGPLPSPAGAPEAAVPDANSLCRSIAAGSPSQLEAGDDTDNSANDFQPTPPAPRNNAGPATGEPCAGGGDGTPPKTKITKHPRKRSGETTAKFKFTSSEDDSRFRCKLDKHHFRSCTSPRTYRRLGKGEHKFQVVASDPSGNADPTPAKFEFEVTG
jgi:hypothetical protein